MQSSASIRMAQRQFHCYGCDREFRMMVNLNDPASSDIKCSHCQCEFVEESKTFNEQPMPVEQPRPQQQQQPSAQAYFQQPERQIPHQQPPQMTFSQQSSFNGMPMRQQQTVTRTYSPNGGWTQSVTISYGTSSNGPHVHQSHVNLHNVRPQAHAQAQAQAQAQNAQQQMPQPQPQPRAQAEPHPQPNMMGGFFGMDPFQGFGAHFAHGGVNAQQQQQQQQRVHVDPFMQMFQGLAGDGNMFFMPMGQQQPRSRGCSADFIRNLPEKDADKKSDCYICLEKCKDGPESCQLPCGHAFDRKCIEHWLKDHDSCPVCRHKLNPSAAAADGQDNEAGPQQQQFAHGPQVFFF